MKNFKIVLLSLLAVLVLAGCGGKAKTLVCTGEEEGMKEEISVKFDKKEKFQEIDMKLTFVATEDMLKVMKLEDIKKMMEESMKSSVDEKLNIKITDNGKDTLYISFAMNREEAEKYFGEEVKDGDSYEDFKEIFEEQKLTCK